MFDAMTSSTSSTPSTSTAALAGTFTLPGSDITLNRMGYGAMQLAGAHVWGPPKDMDAAVAVLREAVALGIDHIDTSDYYGPHVTNQIIRKALHPYPQELTIVTKVGNRRADDASWPAALSAPELISAVHDNLRNLGVEALDVVNLRMQDDQRQSDASVAEPLAVLVDLKRQGSIRHIGMSNVSARQVMEARSITDIVCVQNHYNLAHREDDELVDLCAREGIGFTSFFPLGGFSPLQSGALDGVAQTIGATPLQVALAWLLQRSPTMLLIPGTSSVEHLEQNVAAATLELPSDLVAELDAIGR
jgi:pyridoxine 4-dehydrogenase